MSVGPRIGGVMAALARVSSRRPLITLLLSLLLGAAALVYTARALTFVTSSLRLLPQRQPYVIRLQDYQRDFGELNDIVVVVESPDPESAKRFAARLVQDLGREGVAPSRIAYRVDPAYFASRGLLYLSLDELRALRDWVFDAREFIERYAADPTLGRLFEGLNQQIGNAIVLGFFDLGLGGAGESNLRFLESLIDQVSARLHGASAYVSPWASAFSAASRFDDPDAGYFFSSDRHWLFVFVREEHREGDFAESRESIEVIRRTIRRLGGDFPRVQAGVTGGPAISSDEMVTAFQDSKTATLLAFALTVMLLVGAFRQALKPFLMLATLVISLAWSLGIITLVIGHLSIFSVMFISIVVAIGTDYGIYFLYRYQEELSRGAPPAVALDRSAERAGPGMLLGALSATGAFLVLMLTDFQGIREFGFVSGISVLMAFLSMLVLFPALLALADRRRATPTPGRAAPIARAGWLEPATRHAPAVLAGTLIATGFAIWGASRVGFDYNMLGLQAKGIESVRWEELMLDNAGRSGLAALASASSLDELRRKEAAFAALPSVSKVESVLMVAPDHQTEKLEIIRQLAPLLAPIRVAAPTGLDMGQVRAALDTLSRRLRLATAGGDTAGGEVRDVLRKLDALRDALGRADSPDHRRALEQLQRQIARDFADRLAQFQRSLSPQRIEPGDAPPEIRRRYVGSSGRYLLRLQPAVDIWTQAGAERFVTDLRRVDPDVTGPPITSFEAIRFIRQGYFQGSLNALVLVTILTAAILRTARGTALALSPLALGVVWTLGFMHVFGLDFNLANVWALPLIIGTAAEFGLNIFVRFEEGRDRSGPALAQSTVMAVVLNGFTTMAGFASLMVAHHRGIFGLGLLLTVAMGASVVASLVVLPALLRMVYGPAAVSLPREVDRVP